MKTLKGRVTRVTFHNPENGYSVLRLEAQGETPPGARNMEGRVTVVDVMPTLNEGEAAEFSGAWVEDARYGTQFRAQTASPLPPVDDEGLINYLSSDLFRGIGPHRAGRIVAHFGADTMEVLEQEPQRLKEVLKPRLAEALAAAWAEQQTARRALIFLQGFGVTSAMAQRIYKRFGMDIISAVRQNPWELADEVYGIGFRRADEIALRMGLPRDAPERLRVGLRFALAQMTREGHVFAPRDELLQRAVTLLRLGPDNALPAILDQALHTRELCGESGITPDGQAAIYLPRWQCAESDAARRLVALARTPSRLAARAREQDWPRFLPKLAAPNGIELSQQQRDAVELACAHKLTVLTGGPGTGKTTAQQLLIAGRAGLEEKASCVCKFAVLTAGLIAGKTAVLNRLIAVLVVLEARASMQAACVREFAVLTAGLGTARTATLKLLIAVLVVLEAWASMQTACVREFAALIAGLVADKTATLNLLIAIFVELEARIALCAPTGRAARRLAQATGRSAVTIHRLLEWSPDGGVFTKNEDDPLPLDLLIVDEASMLDLELFHHLLRALPPEAHLLLVGDVDQLPSVGAGNVLRDLIACGLARVIRLALIFRQPPDSRIIRNAHRINRGELPLLDNPRGGDFFFQETPAAALTDEVVSLVKARLPGRYGFDPRRDIQVIAPMYRGVAGIHRLNEALQQALNGGPQVAAKQLGQRCFRVGDKVLQTRNNYARGVFNGDIGFIHAIDEKAGGLEVVMDDRFLFYEWEEAAQELLLAWCISIHRSQGSEYPAVVMPLLPQHYMMLQRNLLYTAVTRAQRLVVLPGSQRAIAMAVRNNRVAGRYSGLVPRIHAVPAR